MPEREAVPGYLTGHDFVAAQRRAAGHAGRRRRRGPGDRHGRADRGGPPPDAHLLQGHAPAGQARAARSSTSRGSCCSTSRSTAWIPRQRLHMIGLLRADGRRRAGHPVLVAHPRGGRAARRRRPRRLCRPARGIGRLPLDPPAHDRPAAPVHDPLVRRPGARGGAPRVSPRSSAPSSSMACSPSAPPTTARSPGSSPRPLAPPASACIEVKPTDDSLESVFGYLVRR